jgi:uncharacterized membrane protein YfcA
MKSVEWPPTGLEIIGIFFLIFFIIIANAGGLGGGGIFTPFMMLFFKLSIFECVPLANFFSFISALNRFVVNFR